MPILFSRCAVISFNNKYAPIRDLSYVTRVHSGNSIGHDLFNIAAQAHDARHSMLTENIWRQFHSIYHERELQRR